MSLSNLLKRKPLELKPYNWRNIGIIERAPIDLDKKIRILLVYVGEMEETKLTLRTEKYEDYKRKDKTYFIPKDVELKFRNYMNDMLRILNLRFDIGEKQTIIREKKYPNDTILLRGEHVSPKSEVVEGFVSHSQDSVDIYLENSSIEARLRANGKPVESSPENGLEVELGKYNPLSILTFPFIPQERREELRKTERLQRVIQQVSPKLYQEMRNGL